MLRFILRRLLQTIPLIIGISLISFAIMQLAPGDYLTAMRASPNVKQETIDRLTHDFGLDKSIPEQYFLWLRNACLGNFGFSFTYKIGVFQLIGQRVYYTLLLSLVAMAVSWCIAIPLGIYIAVRRGGFVDRTANFLAFAAISLPGFFVAILLLVLAQKTGWFPIGGATTPPSELSGGYESFSRWGKIIDTSRHMVIPVAVLGLGGVAGLMRQMRGSIVEVLGENYILAARARGLPESKTILKHALRNAVNPLITLLGFEFAGLLGGAALVENVLDWPGLGQLLLEAVTTQDLYVAMGAFVMGAALLIIGNLLADVMLAMTDPRIKFS